MFLFVAALAFAAQDVKAEWRAICGHNLDRCPNTAGLSFAPAFEDELKRFAGRTRGNYWRRNAFLYDQLAGALGGQINPAVALGRGYRLFHSCVPHNCGQMGAVVLAPGGKIVAAALLGTYWSGDKFPSDYSLEIFFSQRGAEDDRWSRILRRWAEAEVSRFRNWQRSIKLFPINGPITRVRVHFLKARASARR